MDFWITLALSLALTALLNHLLKKRFPNWYQHKITPLTFLAVLLLLWGGHDFWNYVTVARQVAEHYDTPLLYYAAQREVTSGVVKVLLAGAALLAAWFRRPGRKPLRVRTALTLLTLAAVLGTWAVGMFCLTSVTASVRYSKKKKSSQLRQSRFPWASNTAAAEKTSLASCRGRKFPSFSVAVV